MFEFLNNNSELILSIVSLILWEIIGRRKETDKPSLTPINILSKIVDSLLKDKKKGGGNHIKRNINNFK